MSSKNRWDIWLTGISFLIPAIFLFTHGQLRVLLAVMILGMLLVTWMLDHTLAILLNFVYLICLGDLRRIADMISSSGGLDVLLLVSPLFAIILVIPIFLRLKVNDALSKTVLALMAIMIMEIVNPRQGPILVGIAGAMFFVVPILWFWIAREFGNEHLIFLILYRVLLPLSILDAMLGVAQAYIGFFPWEKEWAMRLGSQYIYSAGHLRSFGFSTGAAEFASVLLVASVCVMAAMFSGRKTYGLLFLILLPAAVLSSSRGLIVRLLFASAMVWSLRTKGGRNWLPRFLFALSLGIGVIFYSATQSASDDSGPPRKLSTAEIATAHVTQGLSDPAHSTAGDHWTIFLGGIVKGFTYPIGTGLGAITLGAGKFSEGGASTGSSEIDISDVFITNGFVGGFIYLLLIFLILREAFRDVRERRSIISLAEIGLLWALLGAWIPLGQYAVGPLLWIVVGNLSKSRFSQQDRELRSNLHIQHRKLESSR